MKNVIDMTDHRPPFNPPAFFKLRQREAWAELLAATRPAMHVAARKFDFEFAAILLARFRSGREMSATEHKELQRLLGVLGLRHDEDGRPQTGKLAKYVGGA